VNKRIEGDGRSVVAMILETAQCNTVLADLVQTGATGAVAGCTRSSNAGVGCGPLRKTVVKGKLFMLLVIFS
jgi:hypothetical protein